MTDLLAPLALTASTGALLALPLAPALRELITKRDAGPLATRKDDGKTVNFAGSLRSRCSALQSLLQQDGRVELAGPIECGGAKLYICTSAGQWTGPNPIEVLVICKAPVKLPDGFLSTENFYATEDLDSGKDSILRALLGEKAILLGSGTRVMRWVHAESNLLAGTNCALFGRASSNHSLTLSPGCRFERVYAPVIHTSSDAAAVVVRTESSPFSKLARAGLGRLRFQGRTQVAAGQQHRGDLIVTRSLVMEDDSSVLGSVKANADVRIGRNAEIDGSLVSTRAIQIGEKAFAKGPLISEDRIEIGPGVQIGLPGAPTTVSAPYIRLSPGSVIFGTVWARVEGRVGD